MNSVSKTLFIPLYSKSFVSKQGIILNDKRAEEIWESEKIEIGHKSKSKWLCYFMAMRSKVFDDWCQEKLNEGKDAVVLHLGCGLDSRVERINSKGHLWFDLDFPSVIEVRKKYFVEDKKYKMLDSDVTLFDWLQEVPKGKNAIVVMEGLSMYLTETKLEWLFHMLSEHFNQVSLLVDVYTTLAAKLTKWKNPINSVGVSQVYGVKDSSELEKYGFELVEIHSLTPSYLINELSKTEQMIFKTVFAGSFINKIYRLYEYRKV